MPHFELDLKTKIYYEIAGSESASKKILLVMGMFHSLTSWEKQFNYFASLPDCQVLAFDNRGAGLSTCGLRFRYTTKLLATDALNLLNHVGWNEQVHVIGISLGGMITQELLLLDPPRFPTATLTATHSGKSLPPLSTLRDVIRSVYLRKDEEKLMRVRGSLLFTEDFLFRSAPDDFDPKHIPKRTEYLMHHVLQEMDKERAARTKRTPFKTIKKQFFAVLTHNVNKKRLERIGNAGIRVLVVTGDRDRFMKPILSKQLAANIPNAKLKVYSSVGHGIVEQIHHEYNKLVHSHIEGRP